MGELGLSYVELYNMNWRDFSLKCQGLLMKYQRLAVLTRQLAAVIINSTPGLEEPVKAEDIFPVVFDEIKEKPKVPEYTAEQWAAERARIEKQFEKMNNGKS